MLSCKAVGTVFCKIIAHLASFGAEGKSSSQLANRFKRQPREQSFGVLRLFGLKGRGRDGSVHPEGHASAYECACARSEGASAAVISTHSLTFLWTSRKHFLKNIFWGMSHWLGFLVAVRVFLWLP